MKCGLTSHFWDSIHRQHPFDSEWQTLEFQYKNTFYNASGGTTFFWSLILEKFLRGTAGTFPTTLYIGLSSTTPTDSPTSNWNVTEPSTGGYARQSITVATGSWTALSGTGSTSNSNLISFGTASATWLSGVNLLDWVLWDALTLGNLHIWADLTVAQPVFNLNPVSMQIGAIVVAGI